MTVDKVTAQRIETLIACAYRGLDQLVAEMQNEIPIPISKIVKLRKDCLAGINTVRLQYNGSSLINNTEGE